MIILCSMALANGKATPIFAKQGYYLGPILLTWINFDTSMDK